MGVKKVKGNKWYELPVIKYIGCRGITHSRSNIVNNLATSYGDRWLLDLP